VKLVIAYLPLHKLDNVLNELKHHHVRGLTVSHVQGFGQEHDERHAEYRSFTAVEMTKKLRIEIACRDEEADGILDAIYKAAHTGLRGNGKVFVMPIVDALRLKTGERGSAALGPESASE
jgi:nitrogen regulatory protein PII